MQSISALDALIQYLVDEVSMDGNAGTDISRLDTFVSEFYSPSRSTSSSMAPPPQQNQDEHFLTFVWSILSEQEDISIGVIKVAEKESESEEESKGGKRKNGNSKASITSSHSLEELPAEEFQLGRKALMEKYGDDLRIMVDPDVAWAALTTSHAKLGTITPVVYSLIQLVAREKGTGATTIQIAAALGIDQKAAFHYIRSAVNCGSLKKFKVTANGCATNRLVHTRYLSVSKEWNVHALKENGNESEGEAGGAGGADGSGDEGPQSMAGGSMSNISVLYLASNPTLIESRIIRAIKAEKNQILSHRAVMGSIGIRNYERLDLRRLRSIIGRLVDNGIIERVNISTPGRTGETTLSLRLVKKDQIRKNGNKDGDESGNEEENEEEENNEALLPHALWNIPIEKQILDLLAAADADGLAIIDFKVALGGFGGRSIESILSRFDRTPPPAHLADFIIHSVTENVGREKRTRYFLLSGFLRRCERDNFPVQNLGFKNLDAIGDWSELDSSGFYTNEKQLIKWSNKNLPVSRGGKPKAKSEPKRKSSGGGGRASKPPSSQKSTPVPKVKKKTDAQLAKQAKLEADREAKEAKRVKDEEEKWRAAGNTGEFVAPPPELSYYAKKQQELADRKAKGLPPPPKRAASGGGRRSKATLAEMALAKAEGREFSLDGSADGSGGEVISSPVKRGAVVDSEESGAENPPPVIEKGKSKTQPKSRKASIATSASTTTPKASTSKVTAESNDDMIIVEDNDDDEEGVSARRTKPKTSKGKGRAKIIEIEEDEIDDDAMDVDEFVEPEIIPVSISKPKSILKKASTSNDTPSRPPTRLSISTNSKKVSIAEDTPSRLPTRSTTATESKKVLPSDDTPSRPPTRSSIAAQSTSKALSSKAVEVASVTPAAASLGKKRGRNESVVTANTSQTNSTTQASTSTSTTTPIMKKGKSPNKKKIVEVELEPEEAEVEAENPAKRIRRESPTTAIVPTLIVPSPTPPILPPNEPEASTSKVSSPAVEKKKKILSTSNTAAPKKNIAAFKRQNDTLIYIKDQGGIIVNANRSGLFIKEYFEAKEELKPEKNRQQIYMMDRTVLTGVLNDLVSANSLRLTVTSENGNINNRIDIYYLPTIALDSPEMTEFISKVTQSRSKKGETRRSVITEEGEVKPFPNPGDDLKSIHEYYCYDKQVLSSQYGVYLGRFARARALHNFMIDFVSSNGKENQFIVRKEEGLPIILAHSAIYSELPLHICLRLYPIPVIAPDLDHFLAQPGNSEILCKNLPNSIHRILSIEFSKRGNLQAIMQYLCDLQLIRPLIQIKDSPGTFERPANIGHTTHWEILTQVPLYAFNIRPSQPLIAILNVDTSDSVRDYWIQLQDNSMYQRNRNSNLEPITNANFAPYFDTTINPHLRRTLGDSKRWFDQYFLRDSQIKLLKLYVEEDIELNEAEIQALATAMLAPPDVVGNRLHDLRYPPSPLPLPSPERSVKSKSRSKAKSGTSGKKSKSKSRKKRKVGENQTGDQIQEEEGEEGDGVQAKPVESLSKKLGKKAKAESAQRQKDFSAIFERFKREVAIPVAPDTVINYLSSRFCTGTSRLDVHQLDNELRLLVPDADNIVLDPNYVSIIPASVFNEEAPDPYALPRRSTNKATKKAKVAPRPVAVVQPSEMLPGEFLTTPLPIVPNLAKGQRLPRHFYTPDQDELLLDAAAIIKTRATYINKVIAWASVEVLFPGLSASKLRTHCLQLLAKPEEQAYHQRLQEAWTAIWNEKRGTNELPDPNPQSIKDYDIIPFVRCLRKNINKLSLRFAGPVIIGPVLPKSDIQSLPATLEDFHRLYEVQPVTGNVDGNVKFSSYWKGIGNLARESIIASLSFSAPYEDNISDIKPIDNELTLAMGIIKMVLVTPTASYVDSVAHAFLKPFEPRILEAVEILTNAGVLSKQRSETTRRIPGRGFIINEKYLSHFESIIAAKAFVEAEEKLVEVIKGEEDFWPLEANAGPAVALLYLVSENAIDLSIDLSGLDELRDPNDYETRKASDEHIECDINFVFTGDKSNHNSVPKANIWPSFGITDEVDDIKEAFKKLKSSSKPNSILLSKIHDSIQEAGSDGISRSQLSTGLKPENMSENNFSNVINSLLVSKPPIAFVAGYQNPCIISSEFLSSWAVTVLTTPPPASIEEISKKGKGKGKAKAIEVDVVMKGVEVERKVLPLLWVDMKGQIVPDLWNQAINWIKGTLLTCSGATAAQIANKGSILHIITLTEVMVLLESLEKVGYVERRAPIGWYNSEKEKEGEVAWDVAHWYLKNWLHV